MKALNSKMIDDRDLDFEDRERSDRNGGHGSGFPTLGDELADGMAETGGGHWPSTNGGDEGSESDIKSSINDGPTVEKENDEIGEKVDKEENISGTKQKRMLSETNRINQGTNGMQSTLTNA